MARCQNWFDDRKSADKALKNRDGLDHHLLQVGERFFVGKDFQVAKIFDEYQDVKVLGENQSKLLRVARAAAKVHVPRVVVRNPGGKRGRPAKDAKSAKKRGRPASKAKAALKELKKK